MDALSSAKIRLSCGYSSILKGEFRFQRERLAVHFRVRIDKVVQRIALLRRVQTNVSADGKLHAIVVMGAEKIILLLRMLPGLGRIHRNPSIRRDIKLRPAVISRYRSGVLIRRKRKANLEARGNSRRPHHPDKQRMKIRAVAALRGASPNRIAISPA